MRRAQLEGIEQIMIIFIVVIIGLVFVGIFFKIGVGSSRVERLEKLEEDTVKIAVFVSAMPELQCTKNNVGTANCLNMLKADVLKTNDFFSQNKEFYHKVLGFSKIIIRKKYSDVSSEVVIYDRSISNAKRIFGITLPRLIYDPLSAGNCFELGSGSCDYGFIRIEMSVN